MQTNGHANGHTSAFTNGVRGHHAKSASLPIRFRSEEEFCINNHLPKELILHVFSFLDITTLCRCSQVCKYWYQIAFDGSNWKSINLFNYQVHVEPRVVEKIAQRCRGFLRELKLKGCQNVTDDAIKRFAEKCRLIEKLELYECKKLTDETCRHLGTYCQNLRELDLFSCKEISNTGLKELSACSHLVWLDVSWCNIEDAGLEALSLGCPGLQRIRLKGTKVTSNGIKALASNCPQLVLVVLNYCGANITDTALIHLGRECPNLRVLGVSHCAITDAGLKALALGCPELRTLEMARCSQVTDTGFAVLTRACVQLERLDLEDCSMLTDATLVQLAVNCPRLNTLILSHCDQITDEGVQRLSSSFAGPDHLRYLAMDNCPLLTDQALLHLANDCKQLRYLGIFDCQQITRSAIRRLESQFLDLHVHAYFAPVTPPGSTRERRRRFCRCCTVL